jgi:hypothetical protein
MPVVTITTFQLGVSGVASRSRLTTPTRRISVSRIAFAIGLTASVLPVPVPATIPNPCRGRAGDSASRVASAVSSSPRVRQRSVGMSSVKPSSIVSQAARVGAMTMMRPRAPPEPTNAS